MRLAASPASLRVAGRRSEAVQDSRCHASSRRNWVLLPLLPCSLSLLSADAFAAPLFGPRAVAEEIAPVSAVASSSSPVSAVAALLDGRDALAAAASVVGASEGKRALLLNKLPKLSGTVQTMSALLPAVLGEQTLSDEQLVWVGDVLVGASNVVAMASISTQRAFSDQEVPQASFLAALAAADALLAAVPLETLAAARRRRCVALLQSAESYEQMQDVAAQPGCLGAL